jgi:GMP synthase (glutamine-hydrolysing)
MILLINNSTHGNKLSYIIQIRHALQELRVPFIETKKVDEKLLQKYKKRIKGIILSGSPMILENDSIMNYNYDIYYMLNLQVPILGICFGSQLMTVLNGGTLKRMKKFVCGVLPTTIVPKNCFLFNGITKEINMNFCFSDLPVKPRTRESKVMATIVLNGKDTPIAFKYNDKMFCILGHPEIQHETHIIYRNFYDYCLSF